jgi:hypothetical protein
LSAPSYISKFHGIGGFQCLELEKLLNLVPLASDLSANMESATCVMILLPGTLFTVTWYTNIAGQLVDFNARKFTGIYCFEDRKYQQPKLNHVIIIIIWNSKRVNLMCHVGGEQLCMYVKISRIHILHTICTF